MTINFYRELARRFDECGNVTALINELPHCRSSSNQIELNTFLHEEFYRIRLATHKALPIFGQYGYIYLKHHLLSLSPLWIAVDDQSIQLMDQYRNGGQEQSDPQNYYDQLSCWLVSVMDFYLKLLNRYHQL